MAQAMLYVEMLGGFQVAGAGGSFSRFRTRQTASLFAYLVLHRGKRLSREVLAEMFWPDAPHPDKARASLSVAVSSLRSQLETALVGQVLLVDPRTLGVRGEVVRSDVLEFEQALDGISHENTPEAIKTLRQTLSLFRGTFLPGFYDDWVLSEQARLRDRFITAVRRLGSFFEEEGDIDEAIYWRRQELLHFPEDTGALEHLIQLLIEEKRMEEAAQAYHEAVRRWKDDGLGVLPASVDRCAQEALALYPTLNVKKKPRSAVAPPVVPLALQDVPPLQTHILGVPTLPLDITRFVGRQDELTQLQALLECGDVRLLTLIGPGGIGKTRLALELARQLQQGGGSAYFVSLQEARQGQDFLQAIASSLQVRLPLGLGSEPLEVVASLLSQHGRLLLVLDNMEQLLETDAMEVLRSLLQRAPSLQCLTTSQNRLSVPGERLFPIAPLPTPPVESLALEEEDPIAFEARWPSVALFVDRARESMPDFHLHTRNLKIVARIVHVLEGIPLALLLAAARVQVMSPTEILEGVEARFRLLATNRKNGPERHRSLYASIAWSFDLLRPELKIFLSQLTVFRGSFGHLEAEKVLDIPLALDYLSELCDCSFLTTEVSEHQVRFIMLESLRLFADQQLSPQERESGRRRHAEYFASLAEQARGHWRTDQEPLWMERLESVLTNLRAAMCWSLEGEEPERLEVACRLGSSLGRFWWTNVYHKEGQGYLTELLEKQSLRPIATTEQVVRLKISLITQLLTGGEYEKVCMWGGKALILAKELRDEILEAVIYANMSAAEINILGGNNFVLYSNRAFYLFRKNSDYERLITGYYNAVMGYVRMDNVEQSIKFTCKHYLLALRIRNGVYVNDSIIALAGCLMIYGDKQDALILYKNAIKNSLYSKNFFEMLGALICYCLILYISNPTPELRNILESIYGMRQVLGFEFGIVSSRFIALHEIHITPQKIASLEETKKMVLAWAEERTQGQPELTDEQLRKIVRAFVRSL
jgi:predicted ATPase/DNA-binding SARP family transcriptional activator